MVANWTANKEDHTSTSKWIFMLDGCTIFWEFKKQICIADSTMAVEIIALAPASKEAEWLRDIIHEILLQSKPLPPISIHCDSGATLSRAYNEIYN